MASHTDDEGPAPSRLTDETIVTRRLAVGMALGAGAAAVVGGLGDAVAQSKEGIIILDKQGINPIDPSKPAAKQGNRVAVDPTDPDKPAVKRGKPVTINPSDPDKPAKRAGKVRVNPDNPDVDPGDPDMPTWARELFGRAPGGGGGGGGR